MTDDFSPIFTGDTGNVLGISFIDGLGKAYDLSGVTSYTLFLVDRNVDARTVRAGVGGNWTVVSAILGMVQYTYGAADVAVAGIYDIEVVVQFPGGPVTFLAGSPLEIRSK